MDLEELLGERYSCRAYTRDPIPDGVVERLFAMGQRTPSWCNTQPWRVHLLSGEAVARFGKDLTAHVASGATPAPDLGTPAYTGASDVRRKEAGYALYSALGIDRGDRAARGEQMLKNFSFFGAPHTAVVTTDRDLGTYGAVDSGAYVSTLMLAAESLGLGSIAQGAIGMYADFVREWLDLPEDRLVVCAVSFGYADPEHPANRFRTSRAELDGVLDRIEG